MRHNNITIGQAMICAANGQRDKAEALYLKHRQAENPSVYDIGADARYLAMTDRIILASAFLIILLVAYLLWRSYKYNKVLTEKNRRLLAEIEQREHEQQQAIPDLDRSRLAQLLGTNEHYVTDAISACADGKSVNGFLNEYPPGQHQKFRVQSGKPQCD